MSEIARLQHRDILRLVDRQVCTFVLFFTYFIFMFLTLILALSEKLECV